MTDNSNDNDVSRLARTYSAHPEPDAHGQAAMLLVESLIHALVARSVISIAEAVELVDAATEVKMEIADDLGDSPATMRRSLALLTAISTSLQQDIPRP